MRLYRHPLVQLAATVALTLPWLGVVAYNFAVASEYFLLRYVAGDPINVPTSIAVPVTAIAVLGASFLLAWGAETAEKDVPRPFALAVLAVLAVAPEYAVDGLYAWNAGDLGATVERCSPTVAEGFTRACENANLAVANMTGANRILIGIGWSGIALYTVYQARRTDDPAVENREGWLSDAVGLDRDISTEVAFLLAATVWAFLVPLGGGIDVLDTAVLVGLYALYLGIIIRGDVEHDEEHVGVPRYLQEYPRPKRVAVVLALFVFSGAAILLSVETFAHGLEDIGEAVGIPSFFMIQWIAPLASESPELIVVIVLVNKARSTAGFNALISSKLNQWTLLIGTLVVLYSLALGEYSVLPFDFKQSAEIWITAAQSYFALALLMDFELTVRESIALLVLFLSQVLLEFTFLKVLPELEPLSVDLLLAYTAIYLLAGTVLFVRRRGSLVLTLGLAADAARTAVGRDPVHEEFVD